MIFRIWILRLYWSYARSPDFIKKSIDIVAELSPWEEGKHYDRIGTEEVYEEILGIPKLKVTIPVSPGRNIPIVLETAARQFRLKQAGFDASKDLMNNVFGMME